MEQILGWAATLLFSCITVPQFIKTIQTGNIEGVSIGQYILFIIANLIALGYAILIVQPPLIFKYILAIIITTPYIILYYKIRNQT